MSPRIFSCVLCGYAICDFEDPNSRSWLKHFRTLYSTSTGVEVSGVGLYNDPGAGSWIAPLEYSSRWDDEGYDIYDRDQIGVMKQRPINGRHGYVFHEACWAVLEKFYYPEAVPCARLLEVCESLPLPLQGNGVSWGHDFGGLVFIDNENCYPWEDRVLERDEDCASRLSARANPYDVPEVPDLLNEEPQTPPFNQNLDCSGHITTAKDCFTTLPQELREAIAVYLPTIDVLNLRLASRTYSPIFFSQQFWASRFKVSSDRGWLFETWQGRKSRNWQWLYRRTNEAHSPPGLQNRKRIWKLIWEIKDVLSLRWNGSSEQVSQKSNQDGLIWREMSGKLRPESHAGIYYDFNEGCRLFHEQSIFIPNNLCRISFSTIRLGDAVYITGMQLTSSTGTDVNLGYRSDGEHPSLDVTVLMGFNLAMGSRGVQGIQVVTGERGESQWFGCPYESPRTQRLAFSRSLAALKAGFDGFKMVFLAAAEEVSASIEESRVESETLRARALWYPDVPKSTFLLNNKSSIAQYSCGPVYQPLCWSAFGGPGGVYLQSLIAISVTFLGTLHQIEFHYNTNIPLECRKLGRDPHSKNRKTMHFAIDGPGGEKIEGIETYLDYLHSTDVYNFCNYGVLTGFKVFTNRGRSFFFGDTKHALEGLTVKYLSTAPGTTATGFFINQDPEFAIVSLGLISEAI